MPSPGAAPSSIEPALLVVVVVVVVVAAAVVDVVVASLDPDSVEM